MVGFLGPTELMVIFGIIILLFGASKLPELARSMGSSMGEFKKAQHESEKSLKEFDASIEDASSDEKRTKIQQMALDMNIDIADKTDDELLDLIHSSVKD